jgi:hypothetical protein
MAVQRVQNDFRSVDDVIEFVGVVWVMVRKLDLESVRDATQKIWLKAADKGSALLGVGDLVLAAEEVRDCDERTMVRAEAC